MLDYNAVKTKAARLRALSGGNIRAAIDILDLTLLELSLDRSPYGQKIREIFEKAPAWKSYCEFAARRLKEKYFSDEEYFKTVPCTETVLIQYRKKKKLVLTMNAEMASFLENAPSERLGGKSFRQVFENALLDVKKGITGEEPELIFLTGGVSKLPSVRDWCLKVFSDSIIISGTEPEFSVSRGLSWCGKIDDELRDFKNELEQLKNSKIVETIVAQNIDELYRTAVETLVGPILENAAVPVFSRWRSGEIERLSDTDEELKREITSYLRSEEARELLVKPISKWLRTVADALEEYTVPICIRHHVPYTALSLSSYLSASDIEISLDARNMFAVEEITLMIDSIITILVGLLCGGTGVAVISSGPNGIVVGIVLSLLVLILGKKKMEKALLDMKVPGPMRKLITEGAFKSRLQLISGNVRKDLLKSLEQEKNEEITARMVNEISEQIEECLTKMAAVVEIPLG